MVFETERILIRNLTESDFEAFHDMQSNPRVMAFTTGKGMTYAENRKDLREVIQAYRRPGNNFWVWALERKTDGELLGTGALIVNDSGEDEIGFRFREKFWGRGYGKEITAGLIRHGFESMGIKKIVAYVDKANEASVKILERNMTFEKEFYNEEMKCTDRKYQVENPKSSHLSENS